MSNLGEGIEEKATEKTAERFILSMYGKGFLLDQIADVVRMNVKDITAIIKKKEQSLRK